MKQSPTSRTMKYLRGIGMTVAVTEKWNSFVKIRQDLFGFGDLIAFDANRVLLVQATTDANRASRRTKILSIPEAAAWTSAASRGIMLVTWGAPRKPPHVEEITIEAFSPQVKQVAALVDRDNNSHAEAE